MITHTCLSKLSFEFLAASRQKELSLTSSVIISSLSIHVLFFLWHSSHLNTPFRKLDRHFLTSLRPDNPSDLLYTSSSANVLLPNRKLLSAKNHASLSCQLAGQSQSEPPPKTPRNKERNFPNIDLKNIVQIRGSSPEFGDSCASFHLSGLGRIESCRREGGLKINGSERMKQKVYDEAGTPVG